jgi:mRNA guanylyltransferase
MNLDALASKQLKTSSSVSSGNNNLGPVAKRSRIYQHDIEKVYFQALCEELYYIWDRSRKRIQATLEGKDNFNIEYCEIEIRVGMIILDSERRWKSHQPKDIIIPVSDTSPERTKLNFKAGVDELFTEKLKKLLKKTFHCSHQNPQKLRSDNSKNRWEVDINGDILLSEKKDQFYRKDLALVSHHYDIRIDAATETPSIETNTTNLSTRNYTHERLKRRDTYYSEKYPDWQLDLTEVDVIDIANGSNSINNKSKQRKELELEFEMLKSSTVKLLNESDFKKSGHIISIYATQLMKLLKFCIPFEIDPPFEKPLEVFQFSNGSNEYNEIKYINQLIQSNERNDKLDFIGSMPINLSKRSLQTIQQGNYYCTEKSDGVRYLLYVITDSKTKLPTAILMDRSKKCFKIHGSIEIGSSLGVGTVLDGELVVNRSKNEKIFLIFDILSIDNVSMVKKTFTERLDKIKNEIMNRCKRYQSNIDPKSNVKPIILVNKRFVPKNKLQDLLLYCLPEEGIRVYYDRNNRHCYHHKTDGIIFQPDSPYVFYGDANLLKWKWPELISVDLQVVLDNNNVKLMCLGPEGVLVDCASRRDNLPNLGIFDNYRLIADFQDNLSSNFNFNTNSTSTNGLSGRIAEVSYDVNLGIWNYMHLRKDKIESNYIVTVMAIFLEQAESISIEELEYRLLSLSEADNNFNIELDKLKHELIKKRRYEYEQSNTKPNSPHRSSMSSTTSSSSSSKTISLINK